VKLGDRIAILEEGGVLAQYDTPSEILGNPASPFVADFIGTTNLLTGTVEGVDGGAAVIRLDSGDRCLVAADGRQAGQAIQLSVRPEAITVGAANGANGAAHLNGEVEQVAYLGAAVQYQVRTIGGVGLSVLAGKSGSRFAPGDSVVLAWAPSDALVLGDRSGTVEDAS